LADEREPSAPDTVIDAGAPSNAPPASAPTLTLGALVGRYLILDRLGSGGMGVVYAAYDPELDRKIALKLLRPDSAGGSGGRSRLLREAQAMARLSHPNVVAVFDVGTFGDDVFVAMELVEGTTLKQWLKAQPRPIREVLAVFVQAGRGLEAAHERGLVHRDFKPENVIVDSHGRAHVLDFGLACAAGSEVPRGEPRSPVVLPPELTPSSGTPLSDALTRTGTLLGTPAYMSPEQWHGHAADEQSDQFSFCVALYEALYGERPFDAASPLMLGIEVTGGNLRKPPAGSKVPGWLRTILFHGLAVDKNNRHSSMGALLEALGRDPSRTRRRWFAAVAAVAAVVALTQGFLLGARHRSGLCKGSEQLLVGVWDAPRRQAVQAAFLRTGKVFAQDAFVGAARALDEYTRRWVGLRQEACEATRVRGEQSEELLDLRMECLGQRREEVRALTDLLASADGALVQRSAEALQSLLPLDACENAAALRAPIRLPERPDLRAKVEALREPLARAQALADAGRFKEGLALMKSEMEAVRAASHAPTEAQALHLYGRFQAGTGDAAGAEASLKQALLLAQASRDDLTAARTSISLMKVTNDQLSRFAEALGWAKNASSWITRLGGSAPLETVVERGLGNMYQGADQPEEALLHYQRERELSRKTFGSESAEAGVALAGMASVFVDLDRFDEALRASQEALAIEERTLGATHPNIGQTLNNLSIVLTSLGRWDDAIAALHRASAILAASYPPGHRALGVVQMNLAETYELAGRYDDALAILLPALERQRASLGPAHPDVATLLSDIASVWNRQRKFAAALPRCQQAIAIFERAYGPEHSALAAPLLNLGLAYVGLGQPAQAIAPLERADRLGKLERRLHERIRLALGQARQASGRGTVDEAYP
jgi:tetratricopeptide (TPR) repeat protein